MPACKTCNGCGESKPLEDFAKDTKRKDGRRGRCRACVNAYQQAWREANPDKRREHWKRAFSADPEKYRQRGRAQYHKHKDYYAAKSKQWKAANRAKVVDYERLRTFRKKAATPTSPEAEVRFVEYAQVLKHDPCAYCVGPGGHLDHIVPLSAGGTNVWANSTSACGSCNSSKNAKPLLVWLAGRQG